MNYIRQSVVMHTVGCQYMFINYENNRLFMRYDGALTH